MRKFDEYGPPIHEAWAFHEAFRRLGFSADEIFVRIARNGLDPEHAFWIFVEVHAQGLVFSADAAPLGSLSPEEFQKDWHEFASTLGKRKFRERDLRRAFHGSRALAMSVPIVNGMLAKGFAFPSSVTREIQRAIDEATKKDGAN